MKQWTGIFWVVALALAPSLALHPEQGTAPPASAQVRFALGGNAAEIPADYLGGLVFLPVRVNQSAPSLFELDSTAPRSSIDPQRAAEVGYGGQPAPVLSLSDVDISLASLAGTSEPDFGGRVGRAYEGALGNDFLGSVTAELDYARQTVRLYDPAAFKYSGHGTVLPVKFVSGMPVVRAKIGGAQGKTVEADFVVNTALDASVLVFASYAQVRRLPGKVKTMPASDAPLAGAQKAVLARLRLLQLGPYIVPSPIAVFSGVDRPAGSEPRLAGEIGGDILERFTVIFDYARRRIILDRNSNFRVDDLEDMSGLSIVAGGPNLKRFEVVSVQPETPGSDAGIRKGDVIEGVDGEPAANLSLADLRALFRQIGHPYVVVLSRKGAAVTVTLRMRRLL